LVFVFSGLQALQQLVAGFPDLDPIITIARGIADRAKIACAPLSHAATLAGPGAWPR
jgi:hypothetical protein